MHPKKSNDPRGASPPGPVTTETPTTTLAPERLLRAAEVCRCLSTSRTGLWRLRAELPPVRLSPGRVAWAESAVQAWIAEKLRTA